MIHVSVCLFITQRGRCQRGGKRDQKFQEPKPREMCRPVATRMLKEDADMTRESDNIPVVRYSLDPLNKTDRQKWFSNLCFLFQRIWQCCVCCSREANVGRSNTRGVGCSFSLSYAWRDLLRNSAPVVPRTSSKPRRKPRDEQWDLVFLPHGESHILYAVYLCTLSLTVFLQKGLVFLLSLMSSQVVFRFGSLQCVKVTIVPLYWTAL